MFQSKTMLRVLKVLTGLVTPVILASCITLTETPRAVVSGIGDDGMALTLPCDAAARILHGMPVVHSVGLDHGAFRIFVWNIHKETDEGWQRDLASYAATTDFILLQETVLQPSLRGILADAGLRWVMASSFIYDGNDVGVLTATRIAPVANCTQRALEPLLRIPKSAVISWLRLSGSEDTLAIVNIHAINFDLSIDAYRAQLQALVAALAAHSGPIILAGDFNSWNDARDLAVAETAQQLGLIEFAFPDDRRAVFVGRHLDHVLARGVELVDITAIPVTSSDHNPLVVTFRIR
jgi:endonuclease/exonuclease/phosphatase (EEP) superfamily protein YafD